jgi:hypothetical protein
VNAQEIAADALVLIRGYQRGFELASPESAHLRDLVRRLFETSTPEQIRLVERHFGQMLAAPYN